jgi:uncharacterized membrane protein
MFCPECGIESRGTARFCHKCGSPLPQDIHVSGQNVDGTAENVSLTPGTSSCERTSADVVANVERHTVSTEGAAGAASPAIPDNIAGALSYVLGWLTGIAFLYLGKGNAVVTFHAWQSILVYGAFAIVFVIFAAVPAVPPNGVLYWLIYILQVIAAMLAVILWIFLIVTTYLGRNCKLPLAGDLANKLTYKA